MKLICANFKMNLLRKDIVNYLSFIENKIDKEKVIFFPNNLFLEYFKKDNYLVGSQDISFKDFGAVTGDTSIEQLKELGVDYTLIGHSERRKYFLDDNYINQKMNLALKNDLKIILCIGESLEEKDNNLTNTVLKNQLDEALKNNLGYQLEKKLIIAYEPVWSIGTGIIPNENELKNTIHELKIYLQDTYKLNSLVLYGGSVNLDNISTLETIDNIDGYLIGGACLNPENFLVLIDKIK